MIHVTYSDIDGEEYEESFENEATYSIFQQAITGQERGDPMTIDSVERTGEHEI